MDRVWIFWISVAILAASFGVAFLVDRHKQTHHRKENPDRWKKKIDSAEFQKYYCSAEDFENKLSTLKEDYISKGNKFFKSAIYQDAYNYFRGPCPDSSEIDGLDVNNAIITSFMEHYKNYSDCVRLWNKEYIKRELSECSEMFNDIDGKSLDAQQRLAVVNGEMNCLVAAGAGSGKTLTIAAKSKYLVDRKGIKPEEILLITYTRKAAGEMRGRIRKKLDIDADISTFHSFGLSILRRNNDVIKDVLDENGFNKILKGYFDKTILNHPSDLRDLMNFLAFFLYQNPARPGEQLGDYINKLKAIDLETLKSKKARQLYKKKLKPKYNRTLSTFKGEIVKSYDELMIANYLFLYGIEYEYESRYEFDLGPTYTRRIYKPDFYLPDYEIYIEHFGVDRNMRASFLSEESERYKYESGMLWKRGIHKTNGTLLIETYSFECYDGTIFEKLKNALQSYDVKFRPIDYKEFYEAVYVNGNNRLLQSFTRLLGSFLSLYKSNGSKLNTEPYGTRTKLFIRIFNKFFQYYEDSLKSMNTIDFNDMIIQATKQIPTTEFPYRYIIIDEFQDISLSRFNLISQLIDKTGAKLLAVGDDWQSIFRFAGSDIKLFSKFKKTLVPCEVLKLEQTHRNSQELLSITTIFDPPLTTYFDPPG